jgi:hypothetical protein
MTYSYQPDTYFLHRDGGLYITLHEGRSAADGSATVVYRHVWPFEPCVWTRAASEWTEERFKAVPKHVARDMLETDRAECQARVKANKAARKLEEVAALNAQYGEDNKYA